MASTAEESHHPPFGSHQRPFGSHRREEVGNQLRATLMGLMIRAQFRDPGSH
ncbi:MAG: hypothetical protein JOY58_01465 [Solirubrobacterales bacterium]|nr:hypothetical protein [Solirubrobacterales bacterium]